MLFDSGITNEKRQFIHAVFIPIVVAVLMVLSLMLEQGMGWDFHTAGVYPRRFEHLWGVFTMPFVHSGWGHLFNNVISFVVLGSSLHYFYNQIAPKVLIISYIFSGILLWIIGRESWHIGASGLIYSLAFFLFFSGIIRRHIPLIAISLVVAFLYGSMVWHIFPWKVKDPISWEGHLSGGIIGCLMAVYFRKEGSQKPDNFWAEEDENDEIESDELDSDSDKEVN